MCVAYLKIMPAGAARRNNVKDLSPAALFSTCLSCLASIIFCSRSSNLCCWSSHERPHAGRNRGAPRGGR